MEQGKDDDDDGQGFRKVLFILYWMDGCAVRFLSFLFFSRGRNILLLDLLVVVVVVVLWLEKTGPVCGWFAKR